MGPSEAKFSSKQDYSKSFVEVNLRLPSLSLNKVELQAQVRQCLDQIIQGVSYPKQLFTFQVTVVSDFSQGAGVFPAIMNACILLLNQVGIAQKEASFAPLSFVPDFAEPDNRVELVAN